MAFLKLYFFACVPQPGLLSLVEKQHIEFLHPCLPARQAYYLKEANKGDSLIQSLFYQGWPMTNKKNCPATVFLTGTPKLIDQINL